MQDAEQEGGSRVPRRHGGLRDQLGHRASRILLRKQGREIRLPVKKSCPSASDSERRRNYPFEASLGSATPMRPRL